jgi:uncharacterized membrane protein YozB (DUF420 family)
VTLRDLPALNALLNGASAAALLTGFWLIRRGRWRAHRAAMVTALVLSAAFLASYLVYHYNVGSVRFQGEGWVRRLYLGILLTHTVLAAAVPVLACITLVRALRRHFPRHAAIARWTLPIWLYVSVTGVVIYWMLYEL